MSRKACPWLRHACGASLALALAACAVTLYRMNSITFPVLSGRLDNGLKVAVQRDDSKPSVLITVRYAVGSAHEPKNKRGIAHVVEHLAFRLNDKLVPLPDLESTPKVAPPASPAIQEDAKNTTTVEKKQAKEQPAAQETKKKVPTRVVRYLTTKNAHTNFNETFYYTQVVAPHLEDALASYARQMGDFSSSIGEEILKVEKQVVRNERRSRYERKPLSRWWLDLFANFYPPEHPYQGDAVIGSHDTISSITLADVSAFLEEHYHPNNATLTVIGPVDANETIALIEKHFAPKPKKEPAKLALPDFTPTYREELIVVPDAKNTMVTVVWPLGPADSEEVAAIDLLDTMIGGWFYQHLVSRYGWAFWVWSWVHKDENASMYVAQALVRKHGNARKVASRMIELADMFGSNIDRQGFARAQARSSHAYVFDAEVANDRALAMSRYYNSMGKALGFTEDLERLNALSVGTVRHHANRALVKKRAYVMIHSPVDPAATDDKNDDEEETTSASISSGDAKQASSGGHDDRDTLPEEYRFTQDATSHRAWALSAVQRQQQQEADRFTLPNGIRCQIVQSGELPITAITILLGGGTSLEEPGKEGTASLMRATMGLSGEADVSNRYAMGLRTYHSPTTESLRFDYEIPSGYLDYAAKLIRESIASPKVMRERVQDQRARMLRDLVDSDNDVDVLAARANWKLLGLEDRHGYTTQRSMSNAGFWSVRDYHKALVYPENAVLTVVSDLPPEQVRPIIERRFGGWRATGRPPWEPASVELQAATHTLAVVPVKKSSQSMIRVSYTTPGWQDWQGALRARGVANLLNIKLRRIRRAMGVTYGVSAHVGAFGPYGILHIGTKVQKDATDRAVEQIWRVLQRAQQEPVTEGELERIKRGLMESMANTGESNVGKARTLAQRLWQGRASPEDTLRFVASWTLEDFQEMVNHLLGQTPTLVVAGQEPSPELWGRIEGLPQHEPLRFQPEELL